MIVEPTGEENMNRKLIALLVFCVAVLGLAALPTASQAATGEDASCSAVLDSYDGCCPSADVRQAGGGYDLDCAYETPTHKTAKECVRELPGVKNNNAVGISSNNGICRFGITVSDYVYIGSNSEGTWTAKEVRQYERTSQKVKDFLWNCVSADVIGGGDILMITRDHITFDHTTDWAAEPLLIMDINPESNPKDVAKIIKWTVNPLRKGNPPPVC